MSMLSSSTTTTAPGFRAAALYSSGHQQVVLGLITTKNGELENPQGVKARLAEAAQYVPLEQICLSPQCGFASTEEGMPSAKTSNGKRSVW